MSSLDSEDVLSPTMFPTRQPHRETGASEMAGVLFSKRPGDVDGSANVSQSRWSDMSAEGAGVDELYNSRIARLEEVTAQLERTVGLQKQGMPPAPTSGGSLDVSARTHSVMSSVEIVCACAECFVGCVCWSGRLVLVRFLMHSVLQTEEISAEALLLELEHEKLRGDAEVNDKQSDFVLSSWLLLFLPFDEQQA